MAGETMPPVDLEPLALSLYDIGAVRLGQFVLHSGRRSPIYFDLRLLVSYPAVLRQVAAAYALVLRRLQFDILAAYPYAGLPIGTAIALEMNIPLIYPRKTAKSYGTGKQVEGVWQVGQRAVVIEDLITSGDSILQAIAALKAASLQVEDAVVLIDREQSGREMLAQAGYNLHAIISMRQMLGILERHNRITASKTAEVLALLT